MKHEKLISLDISPSSTASYLVLSNRFLNKRKPSLAAGMKVAKILCRPLIYFPCVHKRRCMLNKPLGSDYARYCAGRYACTYGIQQVTLINASFNKRFCAKFVRQGHLNLSFSGGQVKYRFIAKLWNLMFCSD